MKNNFGLWSTRDNFKLHEAALLIAGHNPDDWTKKSLFAQPPKDFLAVYGRILGDAVKVIDDAVQSDEHPYDYFKLFALTTSKAENVLEVSEEEGLQISATRGDLQRWITSNKLPYIFFSENEFNDSLEADNTFDLTGCPAELYAAVRAWKAVSVLKDKQSSKARIKEWLAQNYADKEFSAEAIERISTVANWNKLGGAPKTE